MKNGLLSKADFRKAAERLESKGWIQGEYEAGTATCAAGALGAVALGEVNMLEVKHFPESVRDALLGSSRSYATAESTIIMYNDRSDTTKEDMQGLLLLLGEIAAEA